MSVHIHTLHPYRSINLAKEGGRICYKTLKVLLQKEHLLAKVQYVSYRLNLHVFFNKNINILSICLESKLCKIQTVIFFSFSNLKPSVASSHITPCLLPKIAEVSDWEQRLLMEIISKREENTNSI